MERWREIPTGIKKTGGYFTMEGFLSVKEATKSYAQGCKAKAATPIGKLFGKAMLAGMMIGMGAAASSVAAHSVANVGLARLTAAVVFPVGLMMVILLGAELFTGDCLMALGVAEKHISVADCIRVWYLYFLEICRSTDFYSTSLLQRSA